MTATVQERSSVATYYTLFPLDEAQAKVTKLLEGIASIEQK
jgi:hypothetical protein